MLSAFIRTFKCQKIFIIDSSKIKSNHDSKGPFESLMGGKKPPPLKSKKNKGNKKKEVLAKVPFNTELPPLYKHLSP